MQPGRIIVFVLTYFVSVFSIFASKLVSVDFVFVQIKSIVCKETYF